MLTTDLYHFLCNVLWLRYFSCLLLKEEEIVVLKISGCQTNIFLDHNALGTKYFAMYITLISLSFVNVELFLVNTETPLKSRNQCRYFKGPTLLNLQLQRSILIPLSFYYVALPFMQKQICEIKSVDKILWYICTNTSLAFVANFVSINYQWMNCFEFLLRTTNQFWFHCLRDQSSFPKTWFSWEQAISLSQASQSSPPVIQRLHSISTIAWKEKGWVPFP